MVLKQELQETTTTSLDTHWPEMEEVILKAVRHVVSSIPGHEIFLEQMERDAIAGASYVAVSEMITKVADDCIARASPILAKFAEEFQSIMTEAAKEVIVELIREQLAQKMKG